jgi:hypothetical protein
MLHRAASVAATATDELQDDARRQCTWAASSPHRHERMGVVIPEKQGTIKDGVGLGDEQRDGGRVAD